MFLSSRPFIALFYILFIFQRAAAQPCEITVTSPSSVKLLQSNGTTDYLTTFSVCPNPLTTVPTITSSSSSQEVLPLASISLTSAQTSLCRNVTALFTFDALVGQTVYTITASTAEYSCAASIAFTIVGFTIFDTVPASSVTTRALIPADSDPNFVHIIYSGENNNVRSDYRDNLARPTQAFKVRIQFPSGIDSTSRSTEFLLNSLSSVSAVSESNAASPVQIDKNKCEVVRRKLEQSLDGPSCGAVFAEKDSDLVFGLRYKPYRDGVTTLSFDWQFLTADDPDLADESYENFLAVQVTGSPPPIVTSVEPQKDFYRAGGEEITVIFDNVEDSIDRTFRVGDIEFPEVPGSFRKLPNGLYEARFVTKPGKGKNLDWNVEISKTSGGIFESEPVDDARDEKISFIDTPLTIDKIEPPFAVSGDVVTLTGYFDQFNPSRPTHEIFIGNKPLSELGIVPIVTEDTISFSIPSRGKVGAAYEFPIIVVMNEEETGSDDFSYVPEEPVRVTIEVYGASYDEQTGKYSVGQCDATSYEANLPPGISDPDEFLWEMVRQGDSTRLNLLSVFPEISAKERQLRLPAKVFGGRTGAFDVFVECTIQNITLSAIATVLKAEAPVIGITLSRPAARTIATPNVPVRIFAILFPPDPECFFFAQDMRIFFEWVYREKKYQYPPSSPSTETKTDLPSPARIGREFVIPQSELRFGNLSVSLLVYVEGVSLVRGTASVNFSVTPSEMIPVIGFGAATVMRSAMQNLEMTGERSFNPDERVRSDIGVEIFKWACRITPKVDAVESGEPCSSDFLPGPTERSFTVSNDTLMRFRNRLRSFEDEETAGTFYLQYTLSVGSVFGMSDPAVQIVVVLPVEKEVASLESVTFYDNRGNVLEWTHIPVSEVVTMVPDGRDVAWSFEIVSPPSAKAILSESENLITLPEYFNPNFSLPSTTALGLRSGSLEAAQEYKILIQVHSSDDSVIPGEVEIGFRTLDLPRLVLSDLPVSTGDLETIFLATAKVNLDNTYAFTYFFYLISANGEEYCLDGCSGASTVQFKVVQAGIYKVLVRLRDMEGAVLLSEEYFADPITATASKTAPDLELSNLDRFLTEAYRSGDHGTTELLAAHLPIITESRTSSSYTKLESDTIRRLLKIIAEIVQISIPTTMTSKSYAKTASLIASASSDYFSSEQIMYTLFSIVHTAVLRVPRETSLDLEDELLAFYNYSARHVFRTFVGSTSRSLRQLVAVPEFEKGATSLLLDMFLLQQEHLTITVARNSYCGAVRQVDTTIEGGVPAREIRELVMGSQNTRAEAIRLGEMIDFVGTYEQPTIPPFSFLTVGVLCTPLQASGIRGQASTFTWCDDVSRAGFRGVQRIDPNQKRLFTLMETMDFVAMSGLAEDGIQTDTSFLVTTNITEVGSKSLKPLPFPKVEGCLTLNTTMMRLGVTASRGCLSAIAFVVNTFGNPFTPRDAAQHVERNFSSISSSISRDRSSTILISSSTIGSFGAIGKDCPLNARKPVITPPRQDVEYAYLVFGGAVVAIAGVTATWVATSSSYVGSTAAAAAAA